ncbi:MAG: DUF488 domain-containing protein [Candidatus Aenigmarchaeota archaeon]|nr:DUF488 domain-containing protein [Candidatus Aenigmarchaeota archaeon]
MMTLYTKSIRAKLENKDGTRICVMRYIRPYYKFDIWAPALAPPEELLMAYKKKRISWGEYEELYRDVLKREGPLITCLANMAALTNVTLLCWELTPENCHRRLISQEIEKYNPDVEIVLK